MVIVEANVTNKAAQPHEIPDTVVKSCLPMVRRLARSVHDQVAGSIELDDLVQVGLMTLIEARGHFVDRGHASFATYARVRIRGAMIDETRKLATLSRKALRERRDLQKLRSRLKSENGRDVTITELADSSGKTLKAFLKSIDDQQSVKFSPLDQAYCDSNAEFADKAPTADQGLETSMAAKALSDAINLLSERQQMVLQMYFVDQLRLEDIADVMGVGSSRVCQIKKIALDLLRRRMKGWE